MAAQVPSDVEHAAVHHDPARGGVAVLLNQLGGLERLVLPEKVHATWLEVALTCILFYFLKMSRTTLIFAFSHVPVEGKGKPAYTG